MKYNFRSLLLLCAFFYFSCTNEKESRQIKNFNADWHFSLEDNAGASDKGFNHENWRQLDLPHDWAIEGTFDESHPATTGGGALPGGIGWYRKSFTLDENHKGKAVYIQFDGVYRNSEVWINGHYLGKRPFGYISFEYDLSLHLNYGESENVIAVKVDNSKQPNSRWYSGSGIYRNVRLVITEPIHVSQWGTFVTSDKLKTGNYQVNIQTDITNKLSAAVEGKLVTTLFENEKKVKATATNISIPPEDRAVFHQQTMLENPRFWDIEKPFQYKALSQVIIDGDVKDEYITHFGIRDFEFNLTEGFILNGEPVKIKGVCRHHDLGSLGAAVNKRAIERQLEILKEMGVNAIRTAHNPPAPELLELCDEMGFIVMDESFDVWKKSKTKYDYSLYWNEWHERDLRDFILRDRNHPSIFIWSIGNEIVDQWDTAGAKIANELAEIVRSMDITRPITAGMNPPAEFNSIANSGALDIIGYNYHHTDYNDHYENFPGIPFIATETTSALATRGYYDKKSDTLKRWPIRWDIPFDGGNPGNTVSAYDQVSTPWGSTHEETWRVIKMHDFMSGMFIWTGFDYLGEPTPYSWPSRSSYFGVVDLAGFPKDSYYMYKSEWTNDPVLHIFPHWNWPGRDSVDVWVYFNAEEVELFLNGRSLGTRRKNGNNLHAKWRVPYTPGTLKAISRTDGVAMLTKTIKTAGKPAKLQLIADRREIVADGNDLSFITVQVQDNNGAIVPNASNLVQFSIEGPGKIVAVDNGNPVSHEPFIADYRTAFNGLALVIVRSTETFGEIKLTAESEALKPDYIFIETTDPSEPENTLANFFGF